MFGGSANMSAQHVSAPATSAKQVAPAPPNHVQRGGRRGGRGVNMASVMAPFIMGIMGPQNYEGRADDVERNKRSVC